MTKTALEEALRRRLTGQGLRHPAFAVAAPVVWGPDGAGLLLEVRAPGISQAGDPCFPGGRIEPGETPAQAAVREIREELGLALAPERLLGRLPTVNTYLGSRTDIFVCVVSQAEADRASQNPAEVSELLRPPLGLFLDRPYAASYDVDGHTVWGMTAAAIGHLCGIWTSVFPCDTIGVFESTGF